MNYLRYTVTSESPDPNERETIDGIIDGMTEQSRTVEKRDGKAMRASHAKSTACVIGKLEIEPDLPPELVQDLFAAPGTHDVAIRFAQSPGEKLADRVSTHCGMAIKIFDAKRERLPGHDEPVQDFVLASRPVFPSGMAMGSLRDGTVIGKATGLPESAKSAVSSFARNLTTG